jgi:hypothetical protein
MDWTVQNVIDSKDQMKSRFCLSWNLSSKVRSYRSTNEIRRSGNIKYLAILDFEHTNMMDHAKKAQAYFEEKKKNPDKFPSVPFSMHFMYKGKKGFSVWEGDEDQVARKVAFMLPEVVYTLIPIVEGREFLKTYMEVKK